MSTRVWTYLPEYEQEKDDILDAVRTVFESGQLILGKSVHGFEQEFAAYHGMAHCVGVDNGTNALVLGLRALGVGPGDEVITVANTAAPTVVAIQAIGAVPVFVDMTASDYLMDVEQVGAAITPRTSCLLPVHLYGQCVPMAALRTLAHRHGLTILEDCAQAHGATHHGERAGAMGTAAAFSFYPTKVLGGYGDGGATLTDNGDVAHRLRRLRYYGMDEGRYYVVETPGYNSRLDEVQAEILRRKLTRLPTYLEGRRRVAERYAEGLRDTDLILPSVSPGNQHVYYVYVVRHPRRDMIMAALRERGIDLNVSYPWPVHLMSGFAHLGYRPGSLPVTEAASAEIFSLPMYPALPPSTQDTVIAAIRDVLGVR
ncbi:DegT/DnrJ/EryC1/StrS family aminotransferase [Phytoactinopolyspora limicola]|uniref:DegT/DnrJ/EryC1/StrS family aminotransferase n=1 Tax=Phytoactinopolyspora limicola TaxID=2715536 RepID=UPI00140871FF|nr:DegT/DnrJ/EryC1/StrS family aminotransferase [Phytoactinopolyspora limicola]